MAPGPAAMLAGVVLAQLVGRLLGRQRPPADMLFGAHPTFSFPSGHVLGACDFLLVAAFLVFSRRRNPTAMALGFAGAGIGVFFAAASRLYLGYHWLTDALASVSISLVILGTVVAVDTRRTARIPGGAGHRNTFGSRRQPDLTPSPPGARKSAWGRQAGR